MEPKPKKARASVLDFGRCSHVSASALSNVLKMVDEMQLPEHYSPSYIARERKKIAYQGTSFGRLNQEVTISGVKFFVQHPLGVLEAASRTCSRFRDFLVRTIDDNGGRATLLFYNDEVVPGNPLAHRCGRKVETCYWAFKEYGMHALSSEHNWHTLCTARSDQVGGAIAGALKDMVWAVRRWAKWWGKVGRPWEQWCRNCLFGAGFRPPPPPRRLPSYQGKCLSSLVAFSSSFSDVPNQQWMRGMAYRWI